MKQIIIVLGDSVSTKHVFVIPKNKKMSHHNRTRQPSEDDEEDDPLDRILKKSGCADLHYKVQVDLNECFLFF